MGDGEKESVKFTEKWPQTPGGRQESRSDQAADEDREKRKIGDEGDSVPPDEARRSGEGGERHEELHVARAEDLQAPHPAEGQEGQQHAHEADRETGPTRREERKDETDRHRGKRKPVEDLAVTEVGNDRDQADEPDPNADPISFDRQTEEPSPF